MRTSVALFLLTAVALRTDADEAQALDPKTQKLVEQIAAAPDAKTAASGYATLFKNPDRKLLAQLKQVKQIGVALRAAWEEALLLGADKELFGKPRKLDLKPPQAVKPEAMQRFLGFVEGRLQVQLPSWWEQTVKSHQRDGLLLERPKHKVSQDVSWEERKDKVVLSVGNERVLFAPALAKKYRRRNRIGFLGNQETCFVAWHTSVGRSYPLLCLNRKSGEPVWEAKVWDWALEEAVKVCGLKTSRSLRRPGNYSSSVRVITGSI